MLPRRTLPILALALGLAACGPDLDDFPTVHDLAAALPLAEVRREVGVVDFGTPEARPHLVAGWQGDRREGGATVVHGKGEVSVLDFFLTAPRSLRAEVRCAPVGAPGTVTAEVNGRPVGTIRLASGFGEHAFDLPEAALRAGSNQLTFRGGRVSWDLLRFRPAVPSPAPPGNEAGTLTLPLGTEIDYYLDLPGEGYFTLEDLEASGGELAVLAQAEGSEERRLATLESGAAQVELPGGLVRLVLRAVPTGATGALRLRKPVVRTRRTAEPPAPESASARGQRPHVVLYLVDTLRADPLGVYGSKAGLTPRLDAFARGATVFDNAIAQSPWTRPSVASVFTGLGPRVHGVETTGDRLPDEAVTLPELLRQAGYRTAAFSTNAQVSEPTGFAPGFDAFGLIPQGSAHEVNRQALTWLDRTRRRSPGAPVFLYLHTIEPHTPYTPPEDLRARFAPDADPGAGSDAGLARVNGLTPAQRAGMVKDLHALYRAEVAAADRAFGELLDALAARGLLDGTLVVFVSDHGEGFDEHGSLGHAHTLFAEVLDVPLIVKRPFQKEGGRVAAPAQHVDLLPTVLAAAGLPIPEGLPGTDLLAPGGPGGRRAVFSHLRYKGREGVSVVHAGWKRIEPLSRRFGRWPRLYHRAEDRGEARDLLQQAPVRGGYLAALIRGEVLAGRPAFTAEPAVMDPETRRALEALGYL